MIDRRTFLTAAALIATPGASAAEPPPEILLVGDSHVFMMERTFRAAARAYGRSVQVVPHGGSSVRQWLRKHWLEKALKRWPSVRHVLVSLGTNCTRVEHPKLAEDVQRLVLLLNDFDGDDPEDTPVWRTGRACTWLLPPYQLDYLEKAVAACEVLAYSPGTLPLLQDGIHCTPGGYDSWVAKIAEVEWE